MILKKFFFFIYIINYCSDKNDFDNTINIAQVDNTINISELEKILNQASIENLTFKYLRNNGYIEKLKNIIESSFDKIYSI